MARAHTALATIRLIFSCCCCAQAKKKKRETVADRVLKGRDPCVIFVMFIIGMNILIVPLSFLMQQ